jgi:Mg2+-importing ATPase
MNARGAWVGWLVGAAALVAVIITALHFSEERQVMHVAEAAQPAWLLFAFVLQALTYLAQGESYRVVTRAARASLSWWEAYRLSLARLFVDQALPVGGVSGTIVVAQALEARGLKRGIVMACVVVEFVGNYIAFAATLAAALVIAFALHRAGVFIVSVAVVFLLFCVACIAGALSLSGRRTVPRLIARIPLIRSGVRSLQQADPSFSRRPTLITQSALLQLVIQLLDAGTVWALVRACGGDAPLAGVFASFTIATLLRTVSVTPGGLGAFEAASTYSLKLVGVPLPVALSATLLFRGLSFWLPMVPGLVFARPLRAPRRPLAGPHPQLTRLSR